MPGKDNKLRIRLKFGVWDLPMDIPRQDEYIYRQAELLIKERYNYYTWNYPNQSVEMYLVMTILDIAVLNKRQEAENDLSPITQRIVPLLKDLESFLHTKEI